MCSSVVMDSLQALCVCVSLSSYFTCTRILALSRQFNVNTACNIEELRVGVAWGWVVHVRSVSPLLPAAELFAKK